MLSGGAVKSKEKTKLLANVVYQCVNYLPAVGVITVCPISISLVPVSL